MTVANASPRRWNVEVDGIRWLPRMIDKARMSASGKLGAYLMGHSPVDRALMRRLGVTTEEFVRVANESGNDAAVWQALRTNGADETRVRRWSAKFDKMYARYIWMWDIDEGYVRPNYVQRLALGIYRPNENWISAVFRKVFSRP